MDEYILRVRAELATKTTLFRFEWIDKEFDNDMFYIDFRLSWQIINDCDSSGGNTERLIRDTIDDLFSYTENEILLKLT